MEGEYREVWKLPYAVDSPPPALWNFDGAQSRDMNSNATGVAITDHTRRGVSNCAFV